MPLAHVPAKGKEFGGTYGCKHRIASGFAHAADFSPVGSKSISDGALEAASIVSM
jgi:hypothetical protein